MYISNRHYHCQLLVSAERFYERIIGRQVRNTYRSLLQLRHVDPKVEEKKRRRQPTASFGK